MIGMGVVLPGGCAEFQDKVEWEDPHGVTDGEDATHSAQDSSQGAECRVFVEYMCAEGHDLSRPKTCRCGAGLAIWRAICAATPRTFTQTSSSMAC